MHAPAPPIRSCPGSSLVILRSVVNTIRVGTLGRATAEATLRWCPAPSVRAGRRPGARTGLEDGVAAHEPRPGDLGHVPRAEHVVGEHVVGGDELGAAGPRRLLHGRVAAAGLDRVAVGPGPHEVAVAHQLADAVGVAHGVVGHDVAGVGVGRGGAHEDQPVGEVGMELPVQAALLAPAVEGEHDLAPGLGQRRPPPGLHRLGQGGEVAPDLGRRDDLLGGEHRADLALQLGERRGGPREGHDEAEAGVGDRAVLGLDLDRDRAGAGDGRRTTPSPA